MLKKLYFKYCFSIVWTIVVLYLSLAHFRTGSAPRLSLPHTDKLVHFAMYFIYTFFLLWETKKHQKLRYKIIIVVYATAFGILMEILQYQLTTYRSSDIYDAIFNSLGAITMAIFFPKLRKIISYVVRKTE